MSAIGFYQAHRKRSLALLDSCYVRGGAQAGALQNRAAIAGQWLDPVELTREFP